MMVTCNGPSCRTRFEPRHEEHLFCSPDCMFARNAANDRKAAAAARKAEQESRRRHRERKERLKSVLDLERAADSAFSRFIHAKDHGRDCCSCVRTFEEVEAAHAGKHGGTWDCCHYLSRAERPDLRYDPRNAALGCKSCNGSESKRRRGTRSEYIQANFRATLVERYGEEVVEDLEKPQPVKRFTKQRLRRIAAYYRRRARHYEKRRGLG